MDGIAGISVTVVAAEVAVAETAAVAAMETAGCVRLIEMVLRRDTGKGIGTDIVRQTAAEAAREAAAVDRAARDLAGRVAVEAADGTDDRNSRREV